MSDRILLTVDDINEKKVPNGNLMQKNLHISGTETDSRTDELDFQVAFSSWTKLKRAISFLQQMFKSGSLRIPLHHTPDDSRKNLVQNLPERSLV